MVWYYLALWALFGVCGRMLSTLPGCSALGTLLTGRAHLNFFYGYTGYFLRSGSSRNIPLSITNTGTL